MTRRARIAHLGDAGLLAGDAREHGAVTILDNTWSDLCCFARFDNGVDISAHAATNYIAGHSDVVAGTAFAGQEAWPRLRNAALPK